MKMFRTLLQHKSKQGRKKRSLTEQREQAAEDVLGEIGIKGKVLEELSLELQMEKRQQEQAKQQESTIIKVTTGPQVEGKMSVKYSSGPQEEVNKSVEPLKEKCLYLSSLRLRLTIDKGKVGDSEDCPQVEVK